MKLFLTIILALSLCNALELSSLLKNNL